MLSLDHSPVKTMQTMQTAWSSPTPPRKRAIFHAPTTPLVCKGCVGTGQNGLSEPAATGGPSHSREPLAGEGARPHTSWACSGFVMLVWFRGRFLPFWD
jgi:hypothetical protein